MTYTPPVAAKIDESNLHREYHPTPGNKYYVVTYLKDVGRDRTDPTEYTLKSWVWGGNTKVLDSNNKLHVFYKDREVLFYKVPEVPSAAAAAADHDVGNGGKRRNNRRKSAKKGGRSRRMRRMRRSNNRKSSRRF